MLGHQSVQGTTATGVGYKTIYNQQRGGNEIGSNSHLKPPNAPSNANAANNRSPRVGRVRGVSPGSSSRDKMTPGAKSGSQGNGQQAQQMTGALGLSSFTQQQ